MADSMNLLRLLEPVVRPAGAPEARRLQPQAPFENRGFDELLRQGLSQPLKFSAHAQQRLQERGIQLNETQIRALQKGVESAEARGAKDALMLMDQLGLIVNVPNRTVLTVLNPDRMDSGVVTKIDSAVFVENAAADRELKL